MDKIINAYITLPDERKKRVIRRYRTAISMWRLFLWTLPVSFLLFLALLVLLFMFPELASGVAGVDIRQIVMLLGIALVAGYIYAAEDWYYRQKILKSIDKS